MKKRIALLGLLMAGSAFSMDEYLPVQQGKLEVDLGYSFAKPTGVFDDDGKRQSWEDLGAPDDYSPILNAFNLQLKYGIAAGLDLELALTGLVGNDDADVSGTDRPEIGVKYATPAMGGAGVYANIALPLATGDLEGPGAGFSTELGGVYQNRFGDFRLTGRAGYEINFEYDGAKAGNVFSVLVKPEAMWTEYVGTYLAVNLVLSSQDEVGDFELDNGGYDLILGPGINAQLLDNLAYEISVPISVAGKNTIAAWGVAAQLYYTLP